MPMSFGWRRGSASSPAKPKDFQESRNTLSVLPLLEHQGCLARSAGSHESARSSKQKKQTTMALASDLGCYATWPHARRETLQ